MTWRNYLKGRRRHMLSQLAAAAATSSGTFSPDDIPNLTGWWDAEDTATITESPAGFCQNIANKETTAKDYQNLIGAQKPALATVSSHQMLSFDGATQWLADLQSNAVLQPGSGDFTMVILHRAPGTTPATGLTWSQTDGGNAFYSLSARVNLARFTMVDAAAASVSVSSTDTDFADGTRYVVMGMRDGANSRLFWGSGTQTLIESTTSPVALPGGFGSVDAVNSAVGRHPTAASNFWQGELGEWLFYKQALSATERAQLFGYLSAKWGL